MAHERDKRAANYITVERKKGLEGSGKRVGRELHRRSQWNRSLADTCAVEPEADCEGRTNTLYMLGFSEVQYILYFMEHLKDMSTVIGGNSESVCQTYLVEKYLLLPEPVRPAMPTLC